MRIKTLVALYFWILEFDDVTCIRSIIKYINPFISKPSNDTVTVTETEVNSPKKEERFLLAYVKYICILLSSIFFVRKRKH